jgi:hypothetical protein
MFGSRPPKYLFGLIVALALIVGAFYVLDYVIHPWAYARSGQPPLVGYWRGEIVFEPGDRRQIVLRLTHGLGWYGSEAESRFNISGTAKVCGPKGKVDYQIHGLTRDRQGGRSTLGFGGESPGAGKQLNATDATWDGEDRLALRTSLYSVGPDGVARSVASADARASSDDRPATLVVELKRTDKDAFDSVC